MKALSENTTRLCTFCNSLLVFLLWFSLFLASSCDKKTPRICSEGLRVETRGDVTAPANLASWVDQTCKEVSESMPITKAELALLMKGVRYVFVSEDQRSLCLPTGTWACAHSTSRTIEIYVPPPLSYRLAVKHETVHMILFSTKWHLKEQCESQHHWMAEHGFCYFHCNMFRGCTPALNLIQ